MGVTFTKDAAERTKKAVLVVEREHSSLLGEQQSGKGAPYVGFWAKITGKDPASNGMKYSWEKLEPQKPADFSTNVMKANNSWGKALYSDTTGYAVEVTGSKYVLKDSFVWLYPSLSEDYYLFRFEGGVRYAKTNAEIPAQTGTTPGAGQVSVFKFNGTQFLDTNEDVRAYHMMTNAEIPIDTIVQITFDVHDGIWLITAQECE